MELIFPGLIMMSAFWLGACPFSLWIGHWLLDKDIRDYGDGNPGAANVVRAGGRKIGCLAVILDIAKGVPFVALSYSLFGFAEEVIIAIALCAILGHAFSPILRLKGGKAIAVTGGTLLAFPQHELLITFVGFMFLGFLFIDGDAWRAMLGPIGSLIYLAIIESGSLAFLFMLCVLAILAFKHFNDLKTIPKPGGIIIHRFQP